MLISYPENCAHSPIFCLRWRPRSRFIFSEVALGHWRWETPPQRARRPTACGRSDCSAASRRPAAPHRLLDVFMHTVQSVPRNGASMICCVVIIGAPPVDNTAFLPLASTFSLPQTVAFLPCCCALASIRWCSCQSGVPTLTGWQCAWRMTDAWPS